ncbi:MAG: hypothetical protein RQM92_15105 [Candidatus Syntrophopropionicum ammoniitolerans]
MENARHLDERLRRIIREVSIWTGSEINKTLLTDFAHERPVASWKNIAGEKPENY